MIRKYKTSNLFHNKVNNFFLLVYCILHDLPRSTVFVFYIENHQIASVNHICPVSSAFTYSEFQRAKINGNAKISLKNFSLYLLGHLQANNQRSKKPFTYSEFQRREIQPATKISSKIFRSLIKAKVKTGFGRFGKNLSSKHYYNSHMAFWHGFGDNRKNIFSSVFFHGKHNENAK